MSPIASLEGGREAEPRPHEAHDLEHPRLAVAGDEELGRVVGRAVHDVRLLLVERVRIDDRIARHREDRARAAPAPGHAVARARELLLVERVQVLDARRSGSPARR